MAESERPHRSSSINSNSNAATSSSSSTDLFICFTSRSSSMRLSSLSPARSACLTTSLSRRLRTSGSLKNGVLNSPMLARKRSGSRFDNNNNNNNIEPSSPKVTCIGQVRVKTRKHVKNKMRARSRRKYGDTSFRRNSSDLNDASGGGGGSGDRWVHLPVTICDSLRSFGCFLPCRSDTNRDRRVEGCGGNGNSCFTTWFVAVEETTPGGKRREIELVVGGEDEDRRRSRRRHVFEGLDLSDIDIKTDKKERPCLSMCSPPKNALLLMRCRSDPVKVAALANRVRERHLSFDDGKEEEEDERRRVELDLEDKKRIELCEKWISGETEIAQVPLAREEEEQVGQVSVVEVEAGKEEEEVQEVESNEKEIEAKFMKSIEEEIRNAIEEEVKQTAKMEEEEEMRKREEAVSITPNVERSQQGNREPDPSPEAVIKGGSQPTGTPYKVLPDCLLLMMCEPKLSMEVSKETWVCTTDFVKCLPGRPPAKKATGDPPPHHQHQHQPKKRMVDSNASSRRRSIDKPPLHLQPPRSSCSYPAAPPIIIASTVVAGANKGYEPPVLPRCKSEPRKSASKLAPEACFWKNWKLEPHPPATVGVSGAGVGC